jgi:hypothetical protein
MLQHKSRQILSAYVSYKLTPQFRQLRLDIAYKQTKWLPLLTECFNRTWRKGVPVTLARVSVTTGLAHRGLDQVFPSHKEHFRRKSVSCEGVWIVTNLATGKFRGATNEVSLALVVH